MQFLYTASTRKRGEPELVDMSYLKGLSYSHTIVAYPASYGTYCSVNHQGMVPEFSYA